MSEFSAKLKAIVGLWRPLFLYAFGDKKFCGKEKTKYVSDETGSRIINIPYSEYLHDMRIPDDAVFVKGISEENDPVENTVAINKTIDSVSENGGGTVCLPEGTFSVSTIRMKNNVRLFIPSKTELRSLSFDENINSSSPLGKGVITAENCVNISVTGGGTISGEGIGYTLDAEDPTPNYALKNFNLYLRVISARKRIRKPIDDSVRRNIINFSDCNGVNIENIRLKDSAVWTLVLDSCNNVKINDIVIDDHMHVANTDGIDICGGKNISIHHSFIASGDDGIVLKPIRSEICDLTVTDCIITSFANCFKIGTETQFDVTDVTVKDCFFFIPDGITQGYSGIAIESCDGSNIRNINISDIEMSGVSSVFLIWLGNRFKYGKKTVGSIDGVNIKNIRAEKTELPSAVTGCVHKGKTYYVKNISLENISAVYRDTGEKLCVSKRIGEHMTTGYPEITRVSHIYFRSHQKSQYRDLPCYSLCLRHAENVSISNVNTTPRKCSRLSPVFMEDVI